MIARPPRPAPAAWRGRRVLRQRRLPPALDAMVSLVCVVLSVGMVVAVLWSATS